MVVIIFLDLTLFSSAFPQPDKELENPLGHPGGVASEFLKSAWADEAPDED